MSSAAAQASERERLGRIRLPHIMLQRALGRASLMPHSLLKPPQLLHSMRPLQAMRSRMQPTRPLPLQLGACFARQGSTMNPSPEERKKSMNIGRAAREARATAIGATPIAKLISYTPHTPSRRHRRIVDKSNLWPGRPIKRLLTRINEKAGRGCHGRITVRGRKAHKHRRMYRAIDFKRRRDDPAVVMRFEYDPNRSGFIALIKYK